MDISVKNNTSNWQNQNLGVNYTCMQEIELLHEIRQHWVQRSPQALARAANIREDLREQLEQFFDRLEVSLETGTHSWMDPILSAWAEALPQSESPEVSSSLVDFIGDLLLFTSKICEEHLKPEQSIVVLSGLLPIFLYCFRRAFQMEMEVRIRAISEQLQQVQQTLEKLDQSKSDFIAVAAHELKTPLTLVDGYAAMLRDALNSRNLTAYELDLLNGIHNGTRRLKAIIDDMIDVSLIDNNLLSLNFQPVWINRILHVLENELHSVIQERQQTLTIQDFPGSGEMTFGDPERLLQVFRNVLTNAIKYTPDGGSITVDGRKLPGFIEVVVKDTGIDIDPEDQLLIFDKFARLGKTDLHSSSKTKFKGGGPGLGLHIARGIVEAHGGAIWVESPGFDEKTCPGSTFHILLPLITQPPDEKMARLLAPLTNKPSKKSIF
jgi:signal transduction histidine kinase